MKIIRQKLLKDECYQTKTKVQKCQPFTAKAWTWSRIRVWSALTEATRHINSVTLSVKMHRDRYRPSSEAWYVAARFITRVIELNEGRAAISCFQIRFLKLTLSVKWNHKIWTFLSNPGRVLLSRWSESSAFRMRHYSIVNLQLFMIRIYSPKVNKDSRRFISGVSNFSSLWLLITNQSVCMRQKS